MSLYETAGASVLDRKLDAIAYEISTRNVILAALKVMLLRKYDRNQPRVPGGCREGGQWCPAGGSGTVRSRLAPR